MPYKSCVGERDSGRNLTIARRTRALFKRPELKEVFGECRLPPMAEDGAQTSAQLGGDVVVAGRQIGADLGDGADHHDGDQCGNQALFDGSCAAFIGNELLEHGRAFSVTGGARGR